MKNPHQNLPETPGVYLMKDASGKILYVGKAGNLRRRVSSYFMKAHDLRIEKLVSGIKKIDYRKTDTAVEALILEAELIKKYRPPFNIREKDDKSFLYVEITKEKFPRVLLVRGKGVKGQESRVVKHYGPFTSASNIREAMRILRRIFQWNIHTNVSDPKNPNLIRIIRKKKSDLEHSDAFARLAEASGEARVDWDRESRRRPCFDYEIGLCPGTCIGAIDRTSYLKNIKNLKLFFEGKKGKALQNFEKEMGAAAKKLDFEKAEKLRRRIFALKHIQDTALIGGEEFLHSTFYIPHSRYRIEGYDISNISGTSAVGSMVVFKGNEPDKNEYRKFKIRTILGSNDIGMLKEILTRRFSRRDWPLPNLILVDGGRGQVNVARQVLGESGLKIPVVGIAKGAKRRKNEFIGRIPAGVGKDTLIRVRDEAHRFAISYHKKLRRVALYSK